MQLGFGRVFFSFSTIFSHLYSESQCSADDQTRAAYVFKLANDGTNSCHPSLSRPPLDHVHSSVHCSRDKFIADHRLTERLVLGIVPRSFPDANIEVRASRGRVFHTRWIDYEQRATSK